MSSWALLALQDKSLELIVPKAHGIVADLDELMKVACDWVDFHTEVLAIMSEVFTSVPLLSVRFLRFLRACLLACCQCLTPTAGEFIHRSFNMLHPATIPQSVFFSNTCCVLCYS